MLNDVAGDIWPAQGTGGGDAGRQEPGAAHAAAHGRGRAVQVDSIKIRVESAYAFSA